MASIRRGRRPAIKGDFQLIEWMEQRVLLSTSPASGNARGPAPAPLIQLAWVALHEFGHSFGLEHSSDPNSIMYPYYNANYNFAAFSSDPAVLEFKSMYSTANVANEQTAWKDALDGSDDGQVTVTYSWVRDGAKMDSGGVSNTDATFDATERSIVIQALKQWAIVSNGTVSVASFNGFEDAKERVIYNFGVSGLVQHDTRFGDIRIATHKFDGAGKTLAHTYYPPPNGGTAAGDSHYDAAENWGTTTPPSFAAPATVVAGSSTTNGKSNARSQPAADVTLVGVPVTSGKADMAVGTAPQWTVTVGQNDAPNADDAGLLAPLGGADLLA